MTDKKSGATGSDNKGTPKNRPKIQLKKKPRSFDTTDDKPGAKAKTSSRLNSGVKSAKRFKPGSLNMGAYMVLHTRLAMALWAGRAPDPAKKIMPIIGALGFASGVSRVWREAELDNPVADWILVKIEERYNFVEELIKKNLKIIEALLEGQEWLDEMNAVVNDEPLRVHLQFHSPWAYRACNLLKHFDDIARYCLTARHIGILPEQDWKKLVLETSQRLRGLFELIQLDPGVHLERPWFREKGNLNLRAARREAARINKKIPYMDPAVLKAEKRANLSPPILPPEQRSTNRDSDVLSSQHFEKAIEEDPSIFSMAVGSYRPRTPLNPGDWVASDSGMHQAPQSNATEKSTEKSKDEESHS